MEYKMVEANCIEHLEKEVNSMIESGWIPIGGPFVTPPRKYSYESFCQAMIRTPDSIYAMEKEKAKTQLDNVTAVGISCRTEL